jgi:hypothetical protein
MTISGELNDIDLPHLSARGANADSGTSRCARAPAHATPGGHCRHASSISGPCDSIMHTCGSGRASEGPA